MGQMPASMFGANLLNQAVSRAFFFSPVRFAEDVEVDPRVVVFVHDVAKDIV